MCHRVMCLVIVVAFMVTTIVPAGYAQSVFTVTPTAQGMGGFMPPPGVMVTATDAFTPAIIKGMTIHPENPLLFDFIVDTGNTGMHGEELKHEGEKLIKYFLAALTVPEDELWVNLSPNEPDRIIPDGLGDTAMGRDMLAQDYLLKQLTASMMYPEDELGEEFWARVYERAYEEFGTTDIPTNTFNKVWIVPEKATVYEHEEDASAYVVKNHLKVMLEEDYEALEHADRRGLIHQTQDKGMIKHAPTNLNITTSIIREILIPEIEREVNEGKHFANLRQIFNSLILATWYKQNLKQSLLGQVYVDQNKTKGVDIQDKDITQKIYNQYLEAFRKGVYDIIKEDYDASTNQVIPRKYFSGGVLGQIDFATVTNSDGKTHDEAMAVAYGNKGNVFSLETGLVEKGLSQKSEIALVLQIKKHRFGEIGTDSAMIEARGKERIRNELFPFLQGLTGEVRILENRRITEVALMEKVVQSNKNELDPLKNISFVIKKELQRLGLSWGESDLVEAIKEIVEQQSKEAIERNEFTQEDLIKSIRESKMFVNEKNILERITAPQKKSLGDGKIMIEHNYNTEGINTVYALRKESSLALYPVLMVIQKKDNEESSGGAQDVLGAVAMGADIISAPAEYLTEDIMKIARQIAQENRREILLIARAERGAGINFSKDDIMQKVRDGVDGIDLVYGITMNFNQLQEIKGLYEEFRDNPPNLILGVSGIQHLALHNGQALRYVDFVRKTQPDISENYADPEAADKFLKFRKKFFWNVFPKPTILQQLSQMITKSLTIDVDSEGVRNSQLELQEKLDKKEDIVKIFEYVVKTTSSVVIKAGKQGNFVKIYPNGKTATSLDPDGMPVDVIEINTMLANLVRLLAEENGGTDKSRRIKAILKFVYDMDFAIFVEDVEKILMEIKKALPSGVFNLDKEIERRSSEKKKMGERVSSLSKLFLEIEMEVKAKKTFSVLKKGNKNKVREIIKKNKKIHLGSANKDENKNIKDMKRSLKVLRRIIVVDVFNEKISPFKEKMKSLTTPLDKKDIDLFISGVLGGIGKKYVEKPKKGKPIQNRQSMRVLIDIILSHNSGLQLKYLGAKFQDVKVLIEDGVDGKTKKEIKKKIDEYLKGIEKREDGEKISKKDRAMMNKEFTILYVEGNEEIRTAAVNKLKALGYKVEGIATADEALEILEKGTINVGFIATKVELMGMTGGQFLNTVKEKHSKISYAVVSAQSPDALSHEVTERFEYKGFFGKSNFDGLLGVIQKQKILFLIEQFEQEEDYEQLQTMAKAFAEASVVDALPILRRKLLALQQFVPQISKGMGFRTFQPLDEQNSLRKEAIQTLAKVIKTLAIIDNAMTVTQELPEWDSGVVENKAAQKFDAALMASSIQKVTNLDNDVNRSGRMVDVLSDEFESVSDEFSVDSDLVVVHAGAIGEINEEIRGEVLVWKNNYDDYVSEDDLKAKGVKYYVVLTGLNVSDRLGEVIKDVIDHKTGDGYTVKYLDSAMTVTQKLPEVVQESLLSRSQNVNVPSVRNRVEGIVKISGDLGDPNVVLGRNVSVAEVSPELIKSVGGIDFNPELMDLQIKRDGRGVPLPLEFQPVGDMHIEGFLPVILNITPVSLPQLLGLADIPQEAPIGYDDIVTRDPMDIKT